MYIQILTTNKIYSLADKDEAGKTLKNTPGQGVLVEIDQIAEEGIIVDPKSLTDVEEANGVVRRLLTAEDRQFRGQLKNAARDYISDAQEKVERNGLNMKILDADLSFDQKKLTFYFSANNRVDFRGLVLDMAKSFDKLIRLQQVGVRDEAKYFGGIGKCGRELCCSKFLKNTQIATIEMAEKQEISAGGTGKLLGCCGKLMCCMSYEVGNYPGKCQPTLKTIIEKKGKTEDNSDSKTKVQK